MVTQTDLSIDVAPSLELLKTAESQPMHGLVQLKVNQGG